MSYKEKPQLKLYKFENNSFVLQAIIDDYEEVSFERNIYQAGVFTITINFNIPNSQLFQRGLFVRFGNDNYDFGEITTIQDSIGDSGKGSQVRTITGYDARYILKRRVIKNMNSNGLWVMTGKGEIVLRNLINDQCGTNAEEKRKLPITNIIPESENAIGKEYSVSEQFTNLYEVCKTIATQSEIGWRLKFVENSLTLECYKGEDRSNSVQFSTSFDSLADGEFQDSSESFSNAIYVGGKGQNDDRDIYEGEDGTPEGLNRFESWDNQSSMTTEEEYEAEAFSMLTQYGQTIQMSGNGLAKSPYEYKKQYDVGDTIKIAFSGKSAIVQILSVTERWIYGNYTIQFNFGKPQNNLADQLQLILRKIQSASDKTNSTDSVRWYTIPTDTEMPKADVTYNTIGFIGDVGSNATFKLYLDNQKTGAKTYHVRLKQLAGSGKLTLTTGKEGATDLVLNSGTYVAIIYVDEDGNVTSQGATATNVIESGNTQPATSGGVAEAISSATANPNVTNATGVLPIAHGGTGETTQANINKNIIADLASGSADVTDGTEFVSSYASDNGFSDENAVNKPYKRQFVKVWNYIKEKISSVLGLTANAYGGTADNATNVNIATSNQNVDFPLLFSVNVTAGNKRIYTDTVNNGTYNPSANEMKISGNVLGSNLPYISQVYSSSNYNSGYFLLAQLEGTGSANHDIGIIGSVVFGNTLLSSRKTDFEIFARGNAQTISITKFVVNGTAPIIATYEAVATNKFIIRLYGQISAYYQRFTTVINLAFIGDVYGRTSNRNVTFPNTHVTSFTGNQITKTNYPTLIETSLPSSPQNGQIWIS